MTVQITHKSIQYTGLGPSMEGSVAAWLVHDDMGRIGRTHRTRGSSSWRKEGMTAIAVEFNRSATGGKWHAMTIKRVLRAPRRYPAVRSTIVKDRYFIEPSDCGPMLLIAAAALPGLSSSRFRFRLGAGAWSVPLVARP
jgi:hypothetical protein